MYLPFESHSCPEIQIIMNDIQHFLTQLIDIPSITGDEQKVSHFLKDYLSEKGMSVHLMPVASDRYNVYATYSENPAVLLTTHMDTVAPFISSAIKDKTIYGRGACDAKGIIAAMVSALWGLEKK